MKKIFKRKSVFFAIILGIVLSGIILMYASYALFSIAQINKSVITIKTGTMVPTFKVDGVDTTTISVAAKETKTFMVTLENTNAASGKFLFCSKGTIADDVTFGYVQGTGIDTPPGTGGVIIAKNGMKIYSLKVQNNTSSNQTITIGAVGGLETSTLSMPSDAKVISEFVNSVN